MKNLLVRLYKNSLWAGIVIMVVFSYHMLLAQIPDQIYVNEGETVNLSLSVPVQLAGKNNASDQNFIEFMFQQNADRVQETGVFSDDTEVYEDCELTCYLFGVIPIKDISVYATEEKTVYASGRVIGIYEQTDGVFVLKTTTVEDEDGDTCAPASGLVESGDYIVSANDTSIDTKEELVQFVQENGTDPITLGILRSGEQMSVTVTPVQAADDTYLLGIWVKDDIAGIGTLTWYDEDGNFGALGHGIGDGETGELLSVFSGRVYTASLIGIRKGVKGTPGQLEGFITYSEENLLGSIASNSNIGIYGMLDAEDTERFLQMDTAFSVAYKQEITLGSAYILSNISGTVESYEIEITDVDYYAVSSNKSIRFTVTDEKLLDLTGGIVQGMSGSPILQNDKITGAVTHVMVNDPAKGYGIFIEEMLFTEDE